MTEKLQIKSSRDVRIIELKCRGLTDAQVSTRMKEENYHKISEATIQRFWSKLKKESHDKLVEELIRQQLLDISIEDDRGKKMKYRDRILEKLMPRRIEQQIEGATGVRIVIEDGNPQLEAPPRAEDDLAK